VRIWLVHGSAPKMPICSEHWPGQALALELVGMASM
jgi:hypothetical protein